MAYPVQLEMKSDERNDPGGSGGYASQHSMKYLLAHFNFRYQGLWDNPSINVRFFYFSFFFDYLYQGAMGGWMIAMSE
mgnify:CR=1 FL=1